MNKKALVDAIAAKTNSTKKETTELVDAVFSTITEELSKGNTVDIAGFGKFVVNERAARTGRNPFTGETMEIAASKAPAFKASKTLKSVVK
ncbi:MAG: HU family DNA-binding protein [Erysipelotrichaceae bacterium]|nr:HU family DNA-binding protein [Erysipelotrichaceae bacterium]